MNIVRPRYTDLFQENFKVLGHFGDKTLLAADQYLFFKFLAEYIVPLIEGAKPYEALHYQWMKERAEFHKKYKKTEMALVRELRKISEKLRATLDEKQLLENPEINQKLSLVENAFEGPDEYGNVLPPQHTVIFNHLCALCKAVLKLGHIDLIKNYGEITSNPQTLVDPKTNHQTSIAIPCFSRFSFAPIRDELLVLDRIMSGKDLDHTWVIWEHLEFARWCWETPANHFEGRKIQYQHAKASGETTLLLNTHSYWIDMQRVKARNPDQKQVFFFEKARFAEYIETLLNRVLLFQEIGNGEDMNAEEIAPYSLQLLLEGNELRLEVVWVKDTQSEYRLIHSFHADSPNQELVSQLLAAQPGEKRSVENPKSQNIGKFFERIKLQGLLEQLFFKRVNKDSATPKARLIYFKDYKDVDLSELMKCIKSLKKVENSWFLPKNESLNKEIT